MAGILSKIAGGINKFSDELINPTSALGRLGMFLGAASGSDLGQAQMMAAQDARLRRRDMFDDEDRDLDRQYRQAQIQKLLAPQQPNDTYERIVARLGQGQGDSYLRTLAEGPPIAVDVQQADGSTVRQYMPRGQFGGNFMPPQPQAAPPGVTFTPIDGGPTQPASGGFRR
ncbi:hypothetical protein SAMN02927924_01435 [Sphingobium faniae]|nr:hypothetical protein SAMN02927924_01435 [Sphingobium faniae]